MTDMMINSDPAPGTAASVSTPSTSPVAVTAGVAAQTEDGSSWGLLLVPILICVVLTLYVSLI